MITLTQKLNVVSIGVPPIIHLSQYDSDFSLVFELYASTGNFTLPSGTTAEIRGTKADGNGYDADATVSGTTITVTGDEQMTAAAGCNVFEIALYKSGKRLNTINFILQVEHAALDADTITSESVLKELNAIIEGAATATQAAQDADAAADRAEAAANDLSGTVQQVATNTQDIANLKDDLSHIEGISDDVKVALLNCFAHVAWIDEHGQDYYDELEAALYDEPVPDPRIVYEIPQGTDISTWAIDTEQHAYTLDEDFTILAKASIDMSSQESGTFLLDSLSRTAPTVGCRLQSGLSNNAVNFTATFNQGSAYGGIGGTTSNTFSKSTHNVIFIMTNYNKYMTVAIYVDGSIELQASNTLTDKEGAVYPSTYYIGMHQGGVARPWPGTVDLFRIYNEALSNNEINEILGLE